MGIDEEAKVYAGDRHTAAAISDNTNFLLFTYTTPSWKKGKVPGAGALPLTPENASADDNAFL